MKKIAVFILLILLIIWLWHTDWVQQVLNGDIDFFDELREEKGYQLLWFTIPVFVLQRVVTFFPFVTLLFVHIHLFGFVSGVLLSWFGTFLGAMTCFYLGRFFFNDYFSKVWERQYEKYYKWIDATQNYGMWGLIALHHIPVLPGNLLSFMGALSPISVRAYFWSSVWGNLSMVWLSALITAGVTTNKQLEPYVWGYVFFAVTLVGMFIVHYRRQRMRYQRPGEQQNEKQCNF